LAQKKSRPTILKDLQRFSSVCTIILLQVYQKKYGQPQINEICGILHIANNSSFEAMTIICQDKMLGIAIGKYETQELEKLCQMLENFISKKEPEDRTAPKKCATVKCKKCPECQNMI
jgi:hypothetical protein